MEDEKEKDDPQVQAEDNSIAVGGINIGGDVSGTITIGHGYTAEQVSVLLKQITTTLQPKPFDGRCPYKGLEVFEEEDAELFFGRERLVEDLVDRVKESRTVFITGPSGSGKSSLVRAGLIHALKQGAIKNSEHWLYETMKPGREPLAELSRMASSFAGTLLAGQNIRTMGLNDATVLAQWCEIALRDNRGKYVVLFIDQFEEVFTQIANDVERVAFLNLLTHAATVENGRVILLFAMRSDFVSNCATYPELNSLLNQQFIQIGSMQPNELVSAIAQPTLRVGLRIDPNLVAQIIQDMRGEPGALPLMQFALKDLFDSQQAQGGLIALTLEDYFRHGGIHKSLERHADNAFTKLSEREKELAYLIFSGLIEIGRSTQDTRRTALFDELVPENTNPEDVKAIVLKLADERLIITDEQAGKDTVTISHEKLIDAWPWLKKLVNENRDIIGLQNEIRNDAKEWADHNHDASYVYTGARLTNVREHLEIKKLVLSGVAREFVHAGIVRQRGTQIASIAAISIVVLLLVIAVIVFGRQAITNAQLAQQKAEIANTAQAASTSAISNANTAEAASTLAVANQQLADERAKAVLARQLAAQSQILDLNNGTSAIQSGLLAVEAARRGVGWGADQALRRYLTVAGLPLARLSHSGSVSSIAFSPDGKYVVSGSEDGTARVWDAATGTEIARMTHDGVVRSVAFGPDGKYVVSGSEDGTARVWDAATGNEIARMTHDDAVSSVAFSPNGKYVVSGGPDDTARTWEVTTGKEIARMIHNGIVSSVAFSPDSKYVVSGSSDGAALVWEATTGEEIGHVTHTSWVFSVAFSSDSKYVVSGGLDGTARVWTATTGEEIARMTYDDIVWSVAFNPVGKQIVSGSRDGTAHVWEASSGQEIVRITPDSTIQSAAFSLDGKYVVSGGLDGAVRVWETATGKEIVHVTHDARVWSVAFSPDNKYIVSGSQDRTARVWEIATGKEIARMTQGGIRSVAYSPDGKYVVTGSFDHTARVWEAMTGKEIARMTHNDLVFAVAFSPDSKYVMSGGCEKVSAVDCSEGTARVWKVMTGQEIARMTYDSNVRAIAFSPDGKYVVSGSEHGMVTIWEAATGKEIAQMTHDTQLKENNWVLSVAFSPDGKYVVSGSGDKTARVWDAATGKELAHMTHDGFVVSVAFSPDSQYVVSGSADKTVRMWETNTGREIARMRHDSAPSVAFGPDGEYVMSAEANAIHLWYWQIEILIDQVCKCLPRNLTREEWAYYIGSEPSRATCPDLPLEPEVTPTPAP